MVIARVFHPGGRFLDMRVSEPPHPHTEIEFL